jgi:hypothetical protein
VGARDLSRATNISRIRENLVKMEWGDVNSNFAAILTEENSDWVALHLARLSEDSLEVVDIKKLEEDLLTPGEGKLFSESANLLIDCKSGLAVGEYKPSAVGILGTRPSDLINHALHGAGITETIDLKPFPSRQFREIVLGKAIDTYDIELGPLSATELEELGLTGAAVRRMVQRDESLALKVKVQVDSHAHTDEEKASYLERLAEKLVRNKAKHFKITTEEYRSFDLVRNNLERFTLPIEFDPKRGPKSERDAILTGMRRALERNRRTLVDRIPAIARYKSKKLDEYGTGS